MVPGFQIMRMADGASIRRRQYPAVRVNLHDSHRALHCVAAQTTAGVFCVRMFAAADDAIHGGLHDHASGRWESPIIVARLLFADAVAEASSPHIATIL